MVFLLFMKLEIDYGKIMDFFLSIPVGSLSLLSRNLSYIFKKLLFVYPQCTSSVLLYYTRNSHGFH